MYKLLENPVMMTKEAIDKKFDGKWVYIVKAKFTEGQQFIEGVPVIVADSPCEGGDDGIYEKYRKPEYEDRYHYNLIRYEPSIPSIFSMEFA